MNKFLRKHYEKKLDEAELTYISICNKRSTYQRLLIKEQNRVKYEQKVQIGLIEHYQKIISILEEGAKKELLIIDDYRKKLGLDPIKFYIYDEYTKRVREA